MSAVRRPVDPARARARRHRRAARGERYDTLDGAAFADLMDELPGVDVDDLDIEREVRRLEIGNASNAYAIRRAD